MRTRTVLAATGAVVALSLGLAAPAEAGGTLNGPMSWARADFGWATSTHTSATMIEVATSPTDGGGVSVSQIATDYDAAGNPGRTVITWGFITSGFRARIDASRFTGARLDAVRVPVQRCVYQYDTDPGTCTVGRPVVVHLRWRGTGPVTIVATGALDDPSTIVTTSRDATVRAHVVGLPDRLGGPQGAWLGQDAPAMPSD